MFMGRIKRATLSLARIGEVSGGVDAATRCLPVHLNGVSPEAPPPPAREQLRSLRATGLAYCHPGSDRGVAEIDVELDRGTLTVVTGPVGSGKSTLVRTLLGLLPADRGEIRWNDERVDDPAGFFVPPRVAYVPQVPRLFSGTLRENIVLGAAFDDEEVFRAVRMAALEPDVALMPDGLDTLVGMRGLRLSGGQIQRVAVARMIIRDPELMVLDDASNALDVDTERELWSNLLAHGRTVLAVSNRPELVSGADQVIRLERGPTGVTATERAQSVEAGA
jgi:ATP-binding cassette subfamily B protein